MRGTTNQTTAFTPVATDRGHGRAGIATFAAPAPVYTPPLSGHHYRPGRKAESASHRTAIIGASVLALIVAGMAGAAYIRSLDSGTTSQVPAVVGAEVAGLTVVPHAALAADAAEFALVPGVVGTEVAGLTVVPHAALAADAAEFALVPAVVGAEMAGRTVVPHAALAADAAEFARAEAAGR